MIALLYFIYFSIVAYLGFYSAFWLISTVIGQVYKAPAKASNKNNPEILLLLPAYQPSDIFLKVLDAVAIAIKNRNIKVLVLLQEADPKYKQASIDHGFLAEEKAFSHLPGNSYHHALRHLACLIKGNSIEDLNPDFAMLLDKDNIIRPDFFDLISAEVYINYDIIQGRRVALNIDGETSFFDTISEGLNDVMFRAAPAQMGNIIEVSGSAALVKTSLFCEAIINLDANAPGYDKNFMVKILSSTTKARMTYLPYSQINEEKTATQEAHNPQRVRWYGEQYFNAMYSATALLRTAISRGRWSALWYQIVLSRPPRSLQLMLVPLLALLEIIVMVVTGRATVTMIISVVSTLSIISAAYITVSQLGLTKQAVQHISHFPRLAWNNLSNAKNSVKKENHGKFIHTEHKL